jgi:hypothetical protein
MTAQLVTLTPPPCTDRNEAIVRIRRALRERTGRSWSVTGGRGTAWGWVKVTAPPARRPGEGWTMSEEDRRILADAMGLDTVHWQGLSIPADHGYRIEYVDRAEGRTPRRIGEPYWD